MGCKQSHDICEDHPRGSTVRYAKGLPEPPKEVGPPDRSTDRLHVHKLSIYLLSVAKNPGSLEVEVDARRQECFGGAEHA